MENFNLNHLVNLSNPPRELTQLQVDALIKTPGMHSEWPDGRNYIFFTTSEGNVRVYKSDNNHNFLLHDSYRK
jgi:hypothetical protein